MTKKNGKHGNTESRAGRNETRNNSRPRTLGKRHGSQDGRLLRRRKAEIKADQEDLKEMREEIKSGQVEMKSTVSAIEEEMDAWIANMRDGRKEVIACQETTEARLEYKEPTLVDMESEAEYQEVPKEEAEVKSSGAVKKRHRGWHLAVGCHGKPKEPTQGNCGSQRKLAATSRKMTHGAGDMVARGMTKSVWYKKPRKDGHSGRDVGRARNATVA
jgi:hypothetical protein